MLEGVGVNAEELRIHRELEFLRAAAATRAARSKRQTRKRIERVPERARELAETGDGENPRRQL
jgi:hypothetical protein